jgi:hypothetical protein
MEVSKEKTFQQGLFVGHGHSNSFDRIIALEPFRRSASGRIKLPTYLVWMQGHGPPIPSWVCNSLGY